MFEHKLSERTIRIAAFAAIYLIWGSTYLAIRLLAETLPGLSGLGVRFFVAGSLLYLFARWRGATAPAGREWRAGVVTGVLMLAGGTGGVVLAIRNLDSGLVALLVGMLPLWIAFLMWFWPGAGARPSLGVVASLLLGFGGVAILIAPGDVLGGEPIYLPAVLVTVFACLSWAVGSLYSRTATLPRSPQLVSGLQMLAGGVALLGWGLLAGEWRSFDPQAVTWTSVLALVYLIVFGSLIAFSAYSWLIRTTEPTLVMTYAYVNPVVAIFLGWLIADEAVSGRILIAAALIICSVVLVTRANGRQKLKRAREKPHDGRPRPQGSSVVEGPQPAAAPGYAAGAATEDSLERCA